MTQFFYFPIMVQDQEAPLVENENFCAHVRSVTPALWDRARLCVRLCVCVCVLSSPSLRVITAPLCSSISSNGSSGSESLIFNTHTQDRVGLEDDIRDELRVPFNIFLPSSSSVSCHFCPLMLQVLQLIY